MSLFSVAFAEMRARLWVVFEISQQFQLEMDEGDSPQQNCAERRGLAHLGRPFESINSALVIASLKACEVVLILSIL